MRKFSFIAMAALVTFVTLSVTGVVSPSKVLADTTLWNDLSGNIYFLTGKLGLGVNDPEVDLEVQEDGAIKLGNAYISDGAGYVANFANNAWLSDSGWVIPNSSKKSQILMQNNEWLYNFVTQTNGSSSFINNFSVDPDGNIKSGLGGYAGRFTAGYQGGKNITIYDENSATWVRFRSGNENNSSNDTVIRRHPNGDLCIGLVSICDV